MVTVRAIKLNQRELTLYVTKFSVKQLRELRDSQQLMVETFDPDRPTIRQGYQRSLKPAKIREIADFVSRDRSEPGADVLLPILPPALVINCRESGQGSAGMLRFDDATGDLTITDRATLYVVDGQHRLEGIRISALKEGYEIPAVIMQGLDIVQEAAQFLTINSKQTSVRPDLELRVLYHFAKDNTLKLVQLLGVENWKLEAHSLAIALNDSNESPWRNLVRRPNDTVPGWKPMREGGFVDTLRFFCGPSGPLRCVSPQDKETHLIGYWEAIRQLYPDAFKQETGRKYHVCRTIGVGIFHTLGPLIYHFHSLYPRRTLYHILSPLARKYPLSRWASKTGDFSKVAARWSSYEEWAAKFAVAIEPRLNMVDEKVLGKLQKRAANIPSDKRILARAERVLRPIGFRVFDAQRSSVSGKKGCYSLVKFAGAGVKVYVGRADNLGQRLGQHQGYDLYNYHEVASDRELEVLEMALYHLVRPAIRDNENHPGPQQTCRFCES